MEGCLDGAGNGKHRPQLRPETHDPVGRVEQRHENGKHAEKDSLTAVPARRRYRLCRSQLHEDTSSETVSAQARNGRRRYSRHPFAGQPGATTGRRGPRTLGRPGTKAHAEALREEIARVVTGWAHACRRRRP